MCMNNKICSHCGEPFHSDEKYCLCCGTKREKEEPFDPRYEIPQCVYGPPPVFPDEEKKTPNLIDLSRRLPMLRPKIPEQTEKKQLWKTRWKILMYVLGAALCFGLAIFSDDEDLCRISIICAVVMIVRGHNCTKK